MMTRVEIEVEALAASVRERYLEELRTYGISIEIPPIPIAELCVLAGLSVIPVVNLDYQGLKLAGMLDAPKKAIYYEATDILGRQNFSIAHELGHYIMHWPLIKNQYQKMEVGGQFVDVEDTFTRYIGQVIDGSEDGGILLRDTAGSRIVGHPDWETEANYFAQFITMPRIQVKEAAVALFGMPYMVAKKALAHQFEVSEMAMDLRLKQLQLYRGFESELEHGFIKELGNPDNIAFQQSPCPTIVVSPQSRLRTLIHEVDLMKTPIPAIEVDFRTFHGADLNPVGMTNAVDLALLDDYLSECSYTGEHENNVPVAARMPESSEYFVRHLKRLGLSHQLGISCPNQEGIDPSQRDTISGNHILLELTHIDKGIDLDKLALQAHQQLLDWTQDTENMNQFADLVARTIYQFAQDVIDYSNEMQGCGQGYIGAHIRRVVDDDQLVGYYVITAAGDIGLCLPKRLAHHFDTDVETVYEALERYCFGENTALLIDEITKSGGYLQINSGDVKYHIGQGSTNHFTGLNSVPGLQITALLNQSLII